jgi:hypothetical protein
LQRRLSREDRDYPQLNQQISHIITENYFAYLIEGDDRVDLISFLKDILIVPPEWDELSRQEIFLFPG